MSNNLVSNPSFEIDSNGDGLADSWLLSYPSSSTPITGTPVASLSSSSYYGDKAQSWSYAAVAGDSSDKNAYIGTTYLDGFVPGEAVTFSAYVNGTVTGCTLSIRLTAYNSSSVWLGDVGYQISPTTSFVRQTITYPSLPANTSKVVAYFRVANIINGDSFSVTIDGAKLEKSATATAFENSTLPASSIDLRITSEGKLRDFVSGTEATITRLGPKYGVSQTGKLAAVEGSATNYLLNSGFETGTVLATNWADYHTISSIATYSVVAGGINGNAQRMQYTEPNAVNAVSQIYQRTAVGSFSEGDTVVVSVSAKGSASGCLARMTFAANGAAGVQVGSSYRVDLVLGSDFQRVSGIIPSAAAGTSRILATVLISQVSQGDSFDVTIDEFQVEKVPAGIIAPSSYIPTTTTAVTRNGKLAAEAYPNGNGYWAAIEEARTNLVTNSIPTTFASNIPTGWVNSQGGTPIIVNSQISGGGMLGDSWRTVYTGQAAGNTYTPIYKTAVGSVAAGNSVTFSFWVRSEITGAGVNSPYVLFYDSAGTYIAGSATAYATFGATSGWERKTLTVTAPAGASIAAFAMRIAGVLGDTVTRELSCFQIEVGAFPTSYIPTTTAAVTRPADVVTFPSTALNFSQGTLAAVVGNKPAVTGTAYGIAQFMANYQNLVSMYVSSNTFVLSTRSADVNKYQTSSVTVAGTQVVTGSFNTGQVINVYGNGTKGNQRTDTHTDPVGVSDGILQVGRADRHANQYNGSLHRLVAFSTALSDTEIKVLSANIINGVHEIKWTKLLNEEEVKTYEFT